jgi:hypothetical protein
LTEMKTVSVPRDALIRALTKSGAAWPLACSAGSRRGGSWRISDAARFGFYLGRNCEELPHPRNALQLVLSPFNECKP